MSKPIPHEKRGRLNNGNPPGDFTKAPRCGAKTRRGTLCMAPAMTNGRCRMHGGCSTGPRTPEGLERSRNARFRHGQCSAEARAEHRENISYLAWARRFFDLAERSDRLFLLVDEIPKQIDANETTWRDAPPARMKMRKCRSGFRIVRIAGLMEEGRSWDWGN